MTSCGFILWLNQVNGQAADNQPATVATDQLVNTESTTGSSQQATPDTTSQNSSVDVNDHGNYANLDSQQINDQGQLVATGWHATNESAGRDYHYLIAYDKTNNREIARQNISGTDNVVRRPDVQRAHNVAGAGQSGFKVTFDLSKVLANTDAVQLVSRYSSDPQGNANNVDYWFAPITVNRSNYASLDGATATDGKLTLTGWHASNQAADKPYHYIIVLDRTTGREVARQVVSERVKRPDVAKALPGIEGAGQSGFTVSFDLNRFNFNHQLQVLSRYSATQDGNSNYLDYYFAPITSGSNVNAGAVDRIDWSNLAAVSISGWHANDAAQFEPNHFLILFDNTANRQVAVAKVSNNQRSDVAKAYPGIKMAGQSGFTGGFDLTKASLTGGHSYAIVSRYSTSDQGNGGAGSYTDYWSAPVTLNQHQSNIDSIRMTTTGLQVSGWMASDYSTSSPYAYVIILNNGHEIARQALTLTDRPDVAKVMSSIYNSRQSGFSTLVKFDPTQVTGNLQVILRFSSDKAGNSQYDDQYSQNYASNQGWFDQAALKGNQVVVSGWHASNQSASHKYHWLIAVDQNGHELGRWQVTNANQARPDLATAVGYILNSDHSGFNITFNVTDNMQHKVIRLIDRLTDDPAGNGNAIDVYSNGVSINSGAQTTGLKTIYYDAMGNMVGVFNNAEVICQNPELPTGCEMTAVTMMLRYAGVNINKFQVAAETPRSSNGDYGFVGNPYSPSGWWVFPTGIAPVVQRNLGTSQVMTGSSLQAIKDKLNIGHLVVVWMANMNGFVNHAITLTGYNNNGFFYNNPWTGQKEAMSYGEFYGHWNADAQRALSY
ncbi:MAG TPA: C39 family peptidase [Candidatus Limosilactobacillus intestinipullorum]|nr:C39 family peptidase [Candidatus Limosilactobacillus intestinipullorum]